MSGKVGKGATAVTVIPRFFWQQHYYGMTGIPAVELNVGTTFSLGGLELAPSISRFTTWENHTFRGEAAVPPSWLLGLTFSRGS